MLARLVSRPTALALREVLGADASGLSVVCDPALPSSWVRFEVSTHAGPERTIQPHEEAFYQILDVLRAADLLYKHSDTFHLDLPV